MYLLKCWYYPFWSTPFGAQEAVPIINTLIELGHPQPTLGTPIETDNSTAHDIHMVQVCLESSEAFVCDIIGSEIE